MIVIESKENLLKSDDEEDLIFDHSTLLHKDASYREPGYRCCPSGGKLQIAKTVNLCLSFFGLGLCFAIPTATLADLQTAVQANENIKNIYTARYSGYLFGAIIGGFLFDCYNRQFLLFLSLLATGIGIIIMPFCQELPALMACTAVTGITMGFLDTGGNVWCLDLWGRRSAPFMQALHFCFGLGAFVAPLVAEPFLSPLSGHLNNSSFENNTFLNGSLLSVPRVGLPQYPLISGKHIIVKHSFSVEFDNSFELPNEYELLDRTKRDAFNESEWANNNNNTTISEIFISPDYNSSVSTNKTSNSENDSLVPKKTSTVPTSSSTTIKPKPKYVDGNKLAQDTTWNKPPLDKKTGNPITPAASDQSNKPSSTASSTSVATTSNTTVAPNTTLKTEETVSTTEVPKPTTLNLVPSNLTEKITTEMPNTTVKIETSLKPTEKSLDTNHKSSQIAKNKVYFPEGKLNDQGTETPSQLPTGTSGPTTSTTVIKVEPTRTTTTEDIKVPPTTAATTTLQSSAKMSEVKPRLKLSEHLPLMMKGNTAELQDLTDNPIKQTTTTTTIKEQIKTASTIESLKLNPPTTQSVIKESETIQNKSSKWNDDIFSVVFDFLHKNRLGKFEIPYILLAVYIFFVAIVFLVFLCKNPREPRSMQLEESNKSRDLSLSFRVVMVGLMALFLCLYVGIEVGVGELLETFATKENLQLPQSRGYFLPYLFWGSFAASRGYSIFVATRVSGRRMLIANLSVCLVASIMLVAGADKLEALLWIGVVVLGLGMGPLFPTSISWLENYLHITNKTASIFILGAAVGEIVIPIIIDLFINQEPMVLMYVNIIVNALCFISFIVLCVMASKREKYGGKKPNRSMYELANTHDYDDSSELLSSANNDHNHKSSSTTNGYYLQVKNRGVSSGNGNEYARISET